MTIFYLNDRPSSHRVYVHTMAYETSILFQPQEAMVIELTAPPDAVPYIKDWGGCTLIGYILPEGINHDQIKTVHRP